MFSEGKEKVHWEQKDFENYWLSLSNSAHQLHSRGPGLFPSLSHSIAMVSLLVTLQLWSPLNMSKTK